MRGVAPSIPWCCTGARVARTVHPAAAAVATLRVTCLGLQNGAGEHLATRWCCSTPSSAPTLPSPCRRRTYMVRLCCARGFNDGFHLVLWRRLALDGGPINGDRVQADATVHAPSTLSCCMPPCVGCGPSPNRYLALACTVQEGPVVILGVPRLELLCRTADEATSAVA